ncbi:MAG: FHA domain-containing protein [Deltaproteobacteria bacterium]|nr:FHA domain-containing protein [Deltaproteobacteria bacterium]
MSEHRGVIQVSVFRDGRLYQTECFSEQQIVLGRSADDDLLLDDPTVSRAHATLRLGPGAVLEIEDLGSSNGTRKNGEPVDRAAIEPADAIAIGPFELRFRLLGRTRHKPVHQGPTRIVERDADEARCALPVGSASALPACCAPEARPEAQAAATQRPGPRSLLAEEMPSEYDVEEIPPDFVEPFSLLTNLVGEDFSRPVPSQPVPVLELIAYDAHRRVRAYEQVSPGSKAELAELAADYDAACSCQLRFGPEMTGGVIQAGQTRPLQSLMTSSRVYSRGERTLYACRLERGDYANLQSSGGSGVFVRFAHPPRLPRQRLRWRPDRARLKILGSAVLAHIALLALIGLFASGRSVSAEPKDPESPRLMQLDLGLFEPELELALQLTGAPVGPDGAGGQPGSSSGMLELLDRMPREPARFLGGPDSLIETVRRPRGQFRLSGPFASEIGKRAWIHTGRGPGFRVGRELLAGEGGRIGVGRLDGGPSGTREIQPVVFPPIRRRLTVRGHLPMEAIYRVVRQHMGEVQRCYAAGLDRDRNQRGRIDLGWTILPSGRVGIARLRSGSLGDPTISSCILSRIRAWRFPRPRGGAVEVTLPLLLTRISF